MHPIPISPATDLFIILSSLHFTIFTICLQSSLDIIGAKENLLGHSDAITSICACRPYSIVVTGSKDSLVIVWDLNRYAMSYWKAKICVLMSFTNLVDIKVSVDFIVQVC